MFEIELYTEKYKDQWDVFVEHSRNGTIFHTRKFLSYHPPGRFEDFSLIFLKDGNIISVLPACVEIENNRRILASHKGSTYGGFVIANRFGIKNSLYLVDIFLEFLVKMGFQGAWIRYPEYIFEIEPSQEIKFAMWYQGFRLDYIELSTCYSLSRFDSIDKPLFWETRKSLREDLRVVINNFAYLSDFYNLLEETLKSKYGRLPTHTFEEITKLKDLIGSNLILVTALCNSEVVGGLLIFIANEKTAHVFYSAGRKDIKGIYPIESCIDFAIRYLKSKGFKYLNYGISTENKGKRLNFELFRFKEKLKGYGTYREVWRWEV